MEAKYGKRVSDFLSCTESNKTNVYNVNLKFQTCDLKFDRDSFVTMRRNGFIAQTSLDCNNRLSETSMGSSE